MVDDSVSTRARTPGESSDAGAANDGKSYYGATPFTAVVGIMVWYYAMWVLIQRVLFLGNYTNYLPASLRNLFPLPPIDAGDLDEPASFIGVTVQNTFLVLLFAVPTAIMASKPYKQWATKELYPKAVERSVLLLVSALTQTVQMRFWVPMPQTVVRLPGFLDIMPLIGYLLIIAATINLDHLSFFGLKQAIGLAHKPHFVHTGIYRFVRHPLLLGELIAWWVYPNLTRGRLLFAVLNTGYVLARAKLLEEPDMIAAFGERYKEYMHKVPAFMPTVRQDDVVEPDKPVETARKVVEEVIHGTKLE